jgi:hypothetical protein
MKSVEISGNIDYKKLISCLFWTNRITTRYVGCDSFLIQKIITKNTNLRGKPDSIYQIIQ